MSASLPTVTVVIPTYMRRSMLPRVIGPLLNDGATSEIVVVVDGSTDGSLEFLRTLAEQDRRLRPVVTDHRGQCSAQQYGASLASSQVLLFLDDDVIPAEGLVSGHALHHRDAVDLLTVGYMPVVIPNPPTAADWVVLRYASLYERKIQQWMREPGSILCSLWGGNMSLRASQLTRVPIGRSDYNLAYHGDLEFGLRCHKAGLRAVFDPNLRANHHYSRTVRQFLHDRATSAANRALIHRLHADLIGPFPADFFEEGASVASKLALRILGGSPSIPAESLVEVSIRFQGWARLFQTQAKSCDLLDRLRGQRIARETLRLCDEGKS